MRHFALALGCVLALAAPAAQAETPAAPTNQDPAAAAALRRGPAVTDAGGTEGYLHRVEAGETLWDISEVYLGTPWVWPSLWKDRDGEGTIRAGDVLFVSEVEIRRVGPDELAAFGVAVEAIGEGPAVPAAMDSEIAGALGPVFRESRFVALESSGFITRQQLETVAEVIGNPTERKALASGDAVYLDAGGLYVQPGDRLRVVRRIRDVPNPDTGRLIGTFVEPLGWAVVTATAPDASKAVIEGAIDEIHAGDLLLRSEDGMGDPAVIELQPTPSSVTGAIALLPTHRVVAGGRDVVYLNRGARHGLERGSALHVIRIGGQIYDERKGRNVRVPDTVIAGAVVLAAEAESSAALITEARDEVQLGDFVRGAEPR